MMTRTTMMNPVKKVPRTKTFVIKQVPVDKIVATLSLPGDFGPFLSLDLDHLPPARARWHRAKIAAILESWKVNGGWRITTLNDPSKDKPIVLIEYPDGTFKIADDGNHRVHVAKYILHLPFVIAKVFAARTP